MNYFKERENFKQEYSSLQIYEHYQETAELRPRNQRV